MGLTVGVVIISHNYGKFLAEAINSVLAQSHPANEIIVVDDSSIDNTRAVAAEFASRGVQYVRVDCKNTNESRRAGFEAGRTDIICFLDADDKLGADYIENGIVHFQSPRIGLVYTDLEMFGQANGTLKLTPHSLDRQNRYHAGSLVRRVALETAQVFDLVTECDTSNDWFLWRRLFRDGWHAVKSTGRYFYRKHGNAQTMRRQAMPYYELANLQHEKIALVLPLSGRRRYFERLWEWVQEQTWPRPQLHLIVLDTSDDSEYTRSVRKFFTTLEVSSFSYHQFKAGAAGLADAPRRNKAVAKDVNLAMPRIYNRLRQYCAEDYIAVVEDDVVPPLDAISRLMEGMTENIALVSGAYRSRFSSGFVAWDQNFQHLPEGRGRQIVHGTGFGCAVLRRSAIADYPFSAINPRGAYDYNFSEWVANFTDMKILIDWDVRCRHGELP